MENAMKHIHRTRGDRIFDAINVAALCLLLAVILYPLIYVLSCSFSDPLLVVQSKITFLPMQPTLVAYQRVFRNELIMTGYQNTLFYTLLGTVLNVAVTTMMAYPLSRHDFAARRPITMLTAFTMLFSGGMIPTFLVVKNLGLIDTVWSLVLPGLVSPWNMFIMKNYFQTSIPTELYEAASIDGADNFHLLRSVVLPLSAPIVAVMVLYYGVAHWNSYFNAVLYLRDRTRYPLQLVLRSFFSANDYSEQGGAGGDSGMTALLVSETMKYALIVIASGPILCLYPLLQRFFVTIVLFQFFFQLCNLLLRLRHIQCIFLVAQDCQRPSFIQIGRTGGCQIGNKCIEFFCFIFCIFLLTNIECITICLFVYTCQRLIQAVLVLELANTTILHI